MNGRTPAQSRSVLPGRWHAHGEGVAIVVGEMATPSSRPQDASLAEVLYDFARSNVLIIFNILSVYLIDILQKYLAITVAVMISFVHPPKRLAQEGGKLKVRSYNRGSVPMLVRFPVTTARRLDALAQQYGITKPEVVRQLVAQVDSREWSFGHADPMAY